MSDIAVILLASGLSKRFGGDKLLADLCGWPVMKYAVDVISRLSFDAKFAVHNGDKSRLRILHDAGFDLIENSNPENGQGSSLALGAALAVSEGYESAVVLLGDMPLITPAHIASLCSRRDESDVIMSECGGVKMPPALFSCKALAALCSAAGNSGASAALKSQALSVTITMQAALDIDTPADLSKVEAILERDTGHG